MQQYVQRSEGRAQSWSAWLHQLSSAGRAARNAHRLDQERTGARPLIAISKTHLFAHSQPALVGQRLQKSQKGDITQHHVDI